MRILSWNLNGLKACLKSDTFEFLRDLRPDVICFQEIRTNEEPVVLDGYHHFWNHGEPEGYSGTALLSQQEPLDVWNGFPDEFPDEEGRIITAEFDDYYIIDVYVPNSQKNLQRQEFRREWDEALQDYVSGLMEEKPVIICGDFNVAREPMDIFEGNTKQYWAQQGYTSDERSDFESLLEEGLVDAFREMHPDEVSFTWWSNRLNKRLEDRGWRIDYFLVSDELMESVADVRHLSDIHGSDHCPILLETEP